ncbi:hemagglutinin repeat-containing protein [Cedecea neteri]|uniref:hemagglutinin repeat-containing protein n=1 Tax=Cedecea neteri TaxID=158822 RepID=UPI00068A6864|nr:hemagglutinin repeat-containing protein [Cedecea neteri]
MNKLCYRIVFNRARQMLVVVSELARAHGGESTRGPGAVPGACLRLSALTFSLWLAGGIVAPLAWADGIVADGSAAGHQQPTVVNTSNGLPQVNIQAPNENGLSHNRYSQFDVGERGAVLNNSRVNSQTQLAGTVAGNPWLAKGEAKVILNEVNSRNPSQLNGFIEVAGKRADVIIANPAGITCSGCGFINANTSTLAAGKARIENGRLQGFDVDNGRIRIEGKGLNDGQSDYTRLIARSVDVNAQLQAKNLQLTTGRNQTDAQGNVLSSQPESAGDKPEFALDVAALGGMYANKIKLVGTERGVGVRNAGEIGASAGELSLSADGKLTNNGLMTSTQAIHVAAGDIDNSGKIRSDGQIQLDARNQATQRGTVLAAGNVQVTAATIDAQQNSVTAAGVDEKGNLTKPGAMTLTASGQLQAQGQLLAGERLSASGQTLDLQGAKLKAKDMSLTATQGDIDTRSATLAADRSLRASTQGQLRNDKGHLSAETLQLQAGAISNREGQLVQTGAQALTLKTGVVDNTQGSITAAHGLAVEAETLNNSQGQVGSFDGGVTLKAARIDNQQGRLIAQKNGGLAVTSQDFVGDKGDILSEDFLSLNSARLSLNGARTEGQQLQLEGNSLSHRGGTLLQRGPGEATFTFSGEIDNSGGQIASLSGVRINAGSLNNQQGTLSGDGDFTLSYGAGLNNQQGSISASAVTLAGRGLDNTAGLIQARGDLSLNTQGQQLNNSQTLGDKTGIRAGGTATLQVGEVNNQSGLIAADKVNAVGKSWDNSRGETSGASELTLSTEGLDNSHGLLSSRDGQLKLNASDAVNNQSGTIQSGSGVTLAGAALDNRTGTLMAANGGVNISLARGMDNRNGRVVGQQGITLNASDLNNQAGRISTPQGAVNLLISGALDNSQGTLESLRGLGLRAGSLNNAGGLVQSADDDASLTLDGALLNGDGRIAARQALTIQGDQVNNQRGRLTGSQLTLTGGALDNTGGLIQATGDLTLDTQGAKLTNVGTSGDVTGIRSGGKLTLRSGDLDNQTGLLAAGQLEGTGGQWDNRGGQISTVGEASLTGTAFNNQGGQIQAGGAMYLDAQQGVFNNLQGQILANQTLTLLSGLLTNQGGTLQGNTMLSLFSGHIDNQSGKLLSGGGLALSANTLNNQQGKVFAWKDGELKVNQDLNNSQGFIKANETLTLAADSVDNHNTRTSGQGIEAGNLQLAARTVNNQQGALRAANQLAADIQAALDNRGGLLSSQQQLDIVPMNASALVMSNQGGELVSQGNMNVQLRQLNGVGRITAEQALNLTTLVHLLQDGTLASNGDLILDARGGLTNSGLLTALRTLGITTPALNNSGSGEIKGSTVAIRAGQMTNTGLVDGTNSHLIADTLHNSGTGRIYGDNLLIDARRLINDKDASQNKAATIAARQRLIVATDNLTNSDHALIYSDGDMAIGGQMSQDGTLSGLAQKVENFSADIEAMGAMHLAAQQIDNRDIHLLLSDAPVLVSSSGEVSEFQFCNGDGDGACFGGDGKRYRLGPWEGRFRYAIDENGNRIPGVSLQKEPGSNNRLRFFIPGGVTKHFYEYRYTRQVWQTQVVQKDPSTIRSGRDLTVEGGTLTNQDSRIIAGGDLVTRTAQVFNNESQGIQRIVEQGQTISNYKGGGNWKTRQSVYAYAGNNSETPLAMGLMQVATRAGQGAGQLIGPQNNSGTKIVADGVTQEAAAGGRASGSGTVDVTFNNPADLDALAASQPGGILDLPLKQNGQASELVVRVVPLVLRLPESSLFVLHPGNSNHYLIETDSRFTSGKALFSSEDVWGDRLQKRLGDGFYEQKLVRDQVAQATGQRFLTGMSDDNEQYKWLLNNGKTFADQYQLKPGVALSAEQAALLTSDMVWMVNKTVTLPDGSTEVVSVPQLYVRVKPDDVTGNGALLAGNRVLMNTQGDVTNSGTVKGRELTQISAENLSNEGFIQGDKLTVLAKNDITNTGGKLMAGDSLTLAAGHDIVSQTQGGRQGTEAWLERTAGIYVENDQGKLILQAGNDIRLTASELVNRGKESDTQLTAGRDLTLDTRQLSHGTDYTRDAKHFDRTLQTSEAGSRIDAGGNLQLSAGRDINARAADLTAQDGLIAQAGHDINLTSGESTFDHEGRSQWTKKGFLSKTTYDFYGNTSERDAQSTTLSGNSVQMRAGNDLTVQGSNVVGTQDVALAAGNNLTLTTADESMHDTQVTQKKKSGLMGTGGIGFTVGSASQKVTTESDSNVKKGSTVGSSAGNVSLTAGNTATVHGSDVVAGQDLSIIGREVAITAAQNSHTELTKTEEKSSGFTLALSGTAGSAVNTSVQQAKSARNESDGRLAALKGTQAALTGVSAAQAVAKDDATGDVKGNDNTVGISLSYGSQSSTSERKLDQQTASGSKLNAGRDIHIQATGGDIAVVGSQLQAGRDTTLNASRDILLSSASNTETVSGSNSSHGGSVGVGIGYGSGGAGINVSASVNAGKGKENGSTVTRSETTVESGNRVTLTSGRDTTLQGAQVSGNSIVADVGRNLTLTSEQDSDRYDSKQQNVSAGASFSFGSMSGSASVNVSRDKMHSNYDSVKEQTGLFAGKGGFDVTVGEHTQLNGAVIGSTASADKNRLDTGTLGWGEIHNQADYKVEHQSAGFSTGGNIGGQFAGNLANTLLTGVNNEGHDSSTTRSAVSAGTITVRDKDKQQQDVADLSRDAEHANQTLSPIFDKEKEQKRLQEAQLISEIGNQAADIARTQGDIAGLKAKKDPAALEAARAELIAKGNKEPTAKQIADKAYNTAMAPYGTGSAIQQGIQAATAAVQGLAGGNIAQAISGAANPYIAEQIHKLTAGNPAAQAMAHAVVGAVVSYAAGNSAAAGAAGAVSGELMAKVVMGALYPGKEVSDLSEEQKQTISALGTLAAGLAGGLAGNSTADVVAGAQTGKNAVENNYLNEKEARQLDKEMLDCKKSGGDCKKVVEKYIDISNKNSKELVEACTGGGVACVSWQELIQGYTNVANDANPHQIRLDEKLKDPSAAALVNYLNGTDLKFLQDNITAGDRVMDVIMTPTSWPVAIMGGKAIITNAVNNTKEQLIAVGITGTASAGIQYGTTGEIKLSDVIGSIIVGGITVGKGYNPTVAWNAVGGYYQAEISGDDPFVAALTSKAGAGTGYAVGNMIKIPMDKVLNPISKQYEWVPTGVWTITKPAPQNPLPSIVGNMGDSTASGLVPKYLEKKTEVKK